MLVGNKNSLWEESGGSKFGEVAVYELDELNGLTAFDSFGTNNATNYNVTINQMGLIDKSYLFNGSNSRLQIPNSSDFDVADNFAISVWVYPTLSADGYIVFKGDDLNTINDNFIYRILITSASRITFTVSKNGLFTGATSVTSDTLALNQWHHLYAEYDGVAVRLRINDSLNFVASLTGNLYNSTANIYIGCRNDLSLSSKVLFFKGNIDQISFFNRVLTSGELTTLYNSGNGLTYSNW